VEYASKCYACKKTNLFHKSVCNTHPTYVLYVKQKCFVFLTPGSFEYFYAEDDPQH
jgi:hypothetical protein